MEDRLPQELKNEIIAALKPLKPERVILFGSYAWGEPSQDSDVDLYVISNDESIPKDYEERMHIQKVFALALRSLMKRIAFDLIVHTKGMSQRFSALNSSFSRQIFSNGIRLL